MSHTLHQDNNFIILIPFISSLDLYNYAYVK